MPEDLIIFQFLEQLPLCLAWDYAWSVPAAVAFVLSAGLELRLLRKRKRRANLCVLLGAVLLVIFCEYGYQAVPGFDAFIFALAEMVLLSALLGAGCGALAGLIWTKVRPL